MDHTMFDAQLEALAERFRCIAYDHRGQGRSEPTRSGYDMDSLTADAAALIERLGAAPCHFVGLSMGGFVGLRLAIRRPELLRSLVLVNTTAETDPPGKFVQYWLMRAWARVFGFRALLRPILPVMFGTSTLADPAMQAVTERWQALVRDARRRALLKATAGVLYRAGVADALHRIRTPTLIVAGAEDTATPPATARRMHAAITGARYVEIPGAGHSSPLEQPASVTAAIQAFLADPQAPIGGS